MLIKAGEAHRYRISEWHQNSASLAGRGDAHDTAANYSKMVSTDELGMPVEQMHASSDAALGVFVIATLLVMA